MGSEGCSFCGLVVCENPLRCERAAEYEADLIANEAVSTITIPVAEYERLVEKARLWDELGQPMRDLDKPAIKEQEG